MAANRYGIDSWTSNGYGIKVEPLTAEQKKSIAELNTELDGKRKAKKPATVKTQLHKKPTGR